MPQASSSHRLEPQADSSADHIQQSFAGPEEERSPLEINTARSCRLPSVPGIFQTQPKLPTSLELMPMVGRRGLGIAEQGGMALRVGPSREVRGGLSGVT